MNNKVYTKFNTKYHCIFIHIPKTGGLSIKNIMYPIGKSGIGHKNISNYLEADSELFREYYKFAIVRNPWDRFVSSYCYLKNGGRNQYDKNWAKENLDQYDNIHDLIYDLSNSEEICNKIMNFPHFMPQHKFICIDGDIMVNYIGRFEKLDESFQHISSVLGVNKELPHDNKSSHKIYSSYYDDDTREIIASIYKRDIDLFEYSYK